MRRKKASEIFAKVDPHLKVVNGGTHYHRKLKEEDWEKGGGVYCSGCHRETMQLIEGLCPQCRRDAEAERAEKLGDKRERRYYKDQLRKGTISLHQMREGRLGN